MQYQAYTGYRTSRFDDSVNIPREWEEKRLKFIASHNDEVLSEKTDPDYVIEYVDISSVNLVSGITQIDTLSFESAPSRARRVVRDGDTVISTVRTYLKAIATIENPPDNMIVSTGFAVIRSKGDIDKNYLSYCLQSQGFVDSVVAYSVGVSYPAINASDLVCLPVYFPSTVADQQKIADFLDHKIRQIDQLIDKKKALIERLNEQHIAVITQAVTKGINENAKMKPSGVELLGDIPEHWEVRRLKFLSNSNLQYGANEAAEMDDPELPRFIRITDVRSDGTLREDTFRSLPEEVAKPFLLNDGDILLARSGATVGKTFIYSESWGKAAYAGYLIRFRANKVLLNADFAYAFFQTSIYWANVNSTLIQSTIQNFNAEKYGDINLPFPPLNEQAAIVEHLKHVLNKIDSMNNKVVKAISTLEEYRSAFITSAVMGKIDVRNIKIPQGE